MSGKPGGDLHDSRGGRSFSRTCVLHAERFVTKALDPGQCMKVVRSIGNFWPTIVKPSYGELLKRL